MTCKMQYLKLNMLNSRVVFRHFYVFVSNVKLKDYIFTLAAGVLINIECKAWAKNIFYDRYERRGSVHFELMVDRS